MNDDHASPHLTGTLDLIPMPKQVAMRGEPFTLDQQVVIVASDEARTLAELLQMQLAQLGFDLPVVGDAGSRSIVLLQQPDSDQPEGYTLRVAADTITIAGADAGLFYGVQTLLQLLPGTRTDTPITVPGVEIEDAPRFGYRGLMLDVARHMQPVAFLKKLLDLMAHYKLNRFHWHLCDDQGWRIEIKRYPRLTDVGAWRKETLVGHYSDQPHRFDATRHGGFYTQDDIREIVAYAAERHILVIPEIEMPGHATSALAAYPELSCTGGPFDVSPLWGIFEDVYCTKDEVFTFLENVLDEVLELFPSPFIHVGGDEVPKTRWKNCPTCQARIAAEGLKDEHELQSYFIRRMEQWLNARGRRLIGWDEILEGGLAPNATVMSWRGVAGGIAAARQHHDVIMTPNSHLYLDYYQGDREQEPLAIGGMLPIDKVYSYDPLPAELSEEEAAHILGVQANVWTEYMPTSEQVEYMIFPRLLALAEIGWSQQADRSYDEFRRRAQPQIDRLIAGGINARRLDDAPMLAE